MANFILSAFADEASNTIEGQIAALKRNGIPKIEPRSVNGALMKKTDEELLEIRKKLDEAGITLSAFGSPIGKVKIEEDFEEYLNTTFRRALEICRILGTNRMRMFSFFVDRKNPEPYREEVIRRLKKMVEIAKAEGIELCHENESEIYGQNPDEVKAILSAIPDLGGIFDASNFVMNDQDAVAGFEATRPSLRYIHIKDSIMENKYIVPVGEGDGHYKEILSRVGEEFDGDVILTLEPHLFMFAQYATIDNHTLKNKYTFDNNDQSFDFAVKALKELLTSIGYREENGKWKK